MGVGLLVLVFGVMVVHKTSNRGKKKRGRGGGKYSKTQTFKFFVKRKKEEERSQAARKKERKKRNTRQEIFVSETDSPWMRKRKNVKRKRGRGVTSKKKVVATTTKVGQRVID